MVCNKVQIICKGAFGGRKMQQILQCGWILSFSVIEAEIACSPAVIGQFGAQEPGSNSDIKSFAKKNYGVTFPLMSKVDVNGQGGEFENQHYQWAASGAVLHWRCCSHTSTQVKMHPAKILTSPCTVDVLLCPCS